MEKSKIEELRNLTRNKRLQITKRDELIHECDHRDAEGYPAVATLDNGDLECQICQTRIPMRNNISVGGLKDCVEDITTAINFMKVVDDTLNKSTLKELGQITLKLDYIPEMYDNVINRQDYQKVNNYNNGNRIDQRAANIASQLLGNQYSNPYARNYNSGGRVGNLNDSRRNSGRRTSSRRTGRSR